MPGIFQRGRGAVIDQKRADERLILRSQSGVKRLPRRAAPFQGALRTQDRLDDAQLARGQRVQQGRMRSITAIAFHLRAVGDQAFHGRCRLRHNGKKKSGMRKVIHLIHLRTLAYELFHCLDIPPLCRPHQSRHAVLVDGVGIKGRWLGLHLDRPCFLFYRRQRQSDDVVIRVSGKRSRLGRDRFRNRRDCRRDDLRLSGHRATPPFPHPKKQNRERRTNHRAHSPRLQPRSKLPHAEVSENAP